MLMPSENAEEENHKMGWHYYKEFQADRSYKNAVETDSIGMKKEL